MGLQLVGFQDGCRGGWLGHPAHQHAEGGHADGDYGNNAATNVSGNIGVKNAGGSGNEQLNGLNIASMDTSR